MKTKPQDITVYCAGPLFNPPEREEMQRIARTFEQAGFRTFLPQRDGLHLARCTEALAARGFDARQAGELLSKAIFALDVYQIIRKCAGIAINLNGRVPDEGAVAEAAIAWHAGKALVGYKQDDRTAFHGQDNPLVAGLFDFRVCRTIEAIVPAMHAALDECPTEAARARQRLDRLDPYLALGERLWGLMSGTSDVGQVAALIGEALSGARAR